MAGLVATAQVEVDAAPGRVWAALTEPAQVREWMFGTTLETDWTLGGPISWSGNYQGTEYRDTGRVLAVDPPHRLTVTHFSPLSGRPDLPGNHHTLTYLLEPRGTATRLSLSQDNNADADEAEHSRANWQQALEALKAYVEGG